MPWRGAEVDGEFPSLGHLVADFIEAHCAIPDRDSRGQPYLLTKEQERFLNWFYRLDPAAQERSPESAWVYTRGAQLVRPQKWGKGPLAAAIVCAEAAGPVRFAGWGADGEPVGRPWSTPLIQITALSEDQTANVWRPLVAMIQLGALSADIPDTGETRINLQGGGRIEPVTASARSRLGNPAAFAVQDESHGLLLRNGGRALADTQRRNIAGMGGRWIETTNAWDPVEESVAQLTAAEPGVYHDDFEPPAGSVRNKRERRKVMQVVYGDSWKREHPEPDRRVNGWVSLDRIDDEIDALILHDPAQAERYFLNRKRATEGAAFDWAKWTASRLPFVVPDGASIVVGVDGARHVDALAMVATEIETGYQWPLGIWEAPLVPDEFYEHPLHEVDGAMIDAFDRYDVWRVYIDPQYIEGLRDTWQGRWGDKTVLNWWMNRMRQAAYAARRFATAIAAGDVTHVGDDVLDRHVGNARKMSVTVYDEDRRQMWVLCKDRPGSVNKIDGAAAASLSWEARGDAIADGVLEHPGVAAQPAQFVSF